MADTLTREVKSAIWKVISRLMRFSHARPAKRIKKILVMRYGFIGDILQTTPILKALGQTWPDAQIDYWVSDGSRAALLNNPYVNLIVSADQHGILCLKKPLVLYRHAFNLRRKHYDLAICLGPDPFYGFLAWLAGIKFRVGLIVDMKKSAFLHACVETTPASRKNHQLTYIELIEKLGIRVKQEDNRIQFYWDKNDEQIAVTNLNMRSDFIAFFCGGGHNKYRPWANRRWSPDSWVELARQINLKYPDVHIVLIGSKLEVEVNKKIASALPEGKVIDLTMRTSFSQLGPLLDKCRLLVSNDSSPVFVAAAVDVPTVAIYGPEWPDRTRPLGFKKWQPVYIDINCRDECASFPEKAPKCDNECMKRITVEMVLSKVEFAMRRGKSDHKI